MTRRPIPGGKRSPSRVSTTAGRPLSTTSPALQTVREHIKEQERRGYSCGKRLRLSKTTTTTTTCSSPSPRGRPKSHRKVCRPWLTRNPLNPTRREQCRSEVQSGSWRRQQAPRSKRRLTLGTLPCQIVSNHAAKRAKLPRVRPLLLARETCWGSRPRRVLGLWQCCSWPWTESPLSASSHDISTKARPPVQRVSKRRARGLSHAAAVHHHSCVSDQTALANTWSQSTALLLCSF